MGPDANHGEFPRGLRPAPFTLLPQPAGTAGCDTALIAGLRDSVPPWRSFFSELSRYADTIGP
jgi:hypothetical protein